MNKGAMFGLDARIALAIFGALSVISGAALYSAIEQAKVTKQIVQLEEIGKALDAYYLDMGSLPRRSHSSNTNSWYYRHDTRYLVHSTDAGWNGPYMPYSYTGNYMDDPEFGNGINILSYTTGSWSDPWLASSIWCESGPDCMLWINIRGIKGINNPLILALDERIDASDGKSTGKFRWDHVNTTLGNDIFYQYRPLQ